VTKLILFDIDGTLVLTGGAGLRSMTRAFEDVFGISGGALDIPMGGRTDAWIVAQVARQRGFTYDESDLVRFHDAYLLHLAREVQLPGPRKGMMPGVRPLLDALAPRDDVHLALLTGNFEQGARIKLEYFDLWRYFECGAFGDRVVDRNLLLPLAIETVRARCGLIARPEDTVVIGDTPLDVAVAVAGGARSIAVATGSHTVEALGETGADVVLPDLADVEAALGAIGLSSALD
jgi:phosphoglycolate phosphatase-like HAD superfamily hydrolase